MKNDVKERTMKVTHKGPAVDFGSLVTTRRIAELARQGDELRAEKVKRVKEMIAQGKYEVDAREVAKSILRAQPARKIARNSHAASGGRTTSWIDGKSAGAHPRGAHAGFRLPLP